MLLLLASVLIYTSAKKSKQEAHCIASYILVHLSEEVITLYLWHLCICFMLRESHNFLFGPTIHWISKNLCSNMISRHENINKCLLSCNLLYFLASFWLYLAVKCNHHTLLTMSSVPATEAVLINFGYGKCCYDAW